MMTADQVFAALADPTRRQIMQQIAAGESATATELAETMPVSRQAVVKHISSLEEAGLVSRERVGREVRYAATPAPLDDAVRWMADVGAAWDTRLARLRDLF